MNKIKKHEISLQEAIDMTTLYRKKKSENMAISETFEAEAIQKLLSTPGCSFLRIYYGMKENNEIHAILVAADSSNEDILPAENTTGSNGDDDEPVIIEDAYRCPPICLKKPPLNPDE